MLLTRFRKFCITRVHNRIRLASLINLLLPCKSKKPKFKSDITYFIAQGKLVYSIWTNYEESLIAVLNILLKHYKLLFIFC